MKKWLGITLALFVIVATITTVVVIKDTKAEATDAMTTYTEKNLYAYGESVTINLQNMDASALGKSAWLGIYKGSDQIGTQSKIWVMLTDANGNLTAGAQRGYFTFPQDTEGGGWKDKRNFEVGDYTVRIVSAANKNLGVDYVFHVGKQAVTDDTVYSLGESVTVTCPDFDAAELGANAWLGIYHEDYTPGSVYWVYLTDASGNLTEGAKTSFTFPKDAEGGGWKGKSLTAGNCTVKIFNASSKAVAGYYETPFTVKGVEISLEKTEFNTDEEVEISYDYLTSAAGKNAWLAIYQANHTIGKDLNRIYAFLTDANSNLKYGESGVINFPNVRDGGAWTLGQHLPAGEYKAVLLGGAGYDYLSNEVQFTVKSPSVALEKSSFKVGESITLSYENVGKYLLGSGSLDWVSLDIYPSTGVVGTTSSEAGGHIYSPSENIMLSASGTITFPADDYRHGDNFPLVPGEYFVVLRSSNTAVDGTKVLFTVTSPFKSIQPELTNSIALHYAVDLGDTITENVSMVFTMNENSETVEGVFEDGVWKFTFDDILPQDMGISVQSDLYVGEKKIDSYTYSVAEYCRKQLDLTTGSTEKDNAFRALLVAMLNYGTEAQKYFNQAVDSYVNADIDQTYLTRYNYSIDEAADQTAIDKNANTGDFVWKTATLGLYDEIKVRIKFYATGVDDLVIMVNGNAYTDYTPCGADLYYVYIPVYADQFDTALKITFLQNGNQQGVELTYSVNSYINYAKDNTRVQSIVKAIYEYGCCAKYYVEQQ